MTLRNKARRLAKYLLIALVAAPLGSSIAQAGDIVYPIDLTITSADPTGNPLQTDTIVGSITTDGTIGIIQASDIVSWDLQLSDLLNATYDYELTPGNSEVVNDGGGGLTATATGLFFNYSDTTAELGFQATNPGIYSGWRYFCFSGEGYACAVGETISPGYFYTDAVVATGTAAPVGTQPLDQVPEPSSVISLPIMLFAVIVALNKRTTARATRPE